MTYRADAITIAGESQRVVLQLWNSYQAGRITADEFSQLAGETLGAYNEQAATVASVALSRDLSRLGMDVDLYVADRSADTERLPKAFATLVAAVASEANAVTVDSVARLARVEPIAAAQDTYSEGLKKHDLRWTRSVSAGACQVCQGLAGAVLPASVPMFHHAGCTCTQSVVSR